MGFDDASMLLPDFETGEITNLNEQKADLPTR
jgi:hypothetical protein